MEVLFVEFGLQQSEEYVNPGEGGGGVHLGILVGLCRPFFTPEKVEIISSLLIRTPRKRFLEIHFEFAYYSSSFIHLEETFLPIRRPY